MNINLTENEIKTLKRIHQLYYSGMYRDMYDKNDIDPICDKYRENFMRQSIEDIITKINVELRK